MRTCVDCKQDLPLDRFTPIATRRWSGHKAKCKSCYLIYQRGRRDIALRAGNVCTVPGCERASAMYHEARLCAMHHARKKRTGDVGPAEASKTVRPELGRHLNAGGYVMVKTDGRWRIEHRVVMERILGRPLLPTETVHHVNGVKTDNRPDNLELWTTHQPKGQRVEDKVAWAVELLALYSPDMLADQISAVGSSRSA